MLRAHFPPARRPGRYLTVITALIFVFLIAVLFDLPAQTHKQTQLRPEKPQKHAKSSADIFVELAEKAGQGVPAKRLAEYLRRSDPASSKRYWAIVDFNQASTAKRFYIFDTEKRETTTYLVSHGKGSEGSEDDGMAETFSNVEGSSSSSLGIYRCLDEYVGNHGRSMRLEGLEATNSNALDRAVVFHTADYATDSFIRQTGRLGRSDGCFAVDPTVGDLLIDRLKNGAYIIAWKR